MLAPPHPIAGERRALKRWSKLDPVPERVVRDPIAFLIAGLLTRLSMGQGRWQVQESRVDTAHDHRRMRTLFAANGVSRTLAELAWKYSSEADCHPFLALAVLGEKTAGMYATVPARFLVNGRCVRGAQSIDTMVHHDFRGRGIFASLATAVHEAMNEGDVAFVYGFPNHNSFRRFSHYLRWEFLDPVPFLFRPLRMGFVLRSLGLRPAKWMDVGLPLGRKSLPCERSEELPSESQVDSLWSEFSRSCRVARVRDYRYLLHRYGQHPQFEYHYRTTWQDGKLSGLVIYRFADKHGGRVGYVMEMMTRSSAPRAARILLQAALSDMVRGGCEGCLAWCFPHSPAFGDYLARGFCPLPERLRPVELHLGYRPFSPQLGPVLAKRKNWYLSYSDSDTV